MKIIYFFTLLFLHCQSKSNEKPKTSFSNHTIKIKKENKQFKNRDSLIKEAVTFCIKNKMDTSLAIFINYKKHSGLKRAYLVQLNKKMVIDSFMVSHGCGDSAWGADLTKENPKFSNEFESHCSSLGKYKLYGRAYSDWGINIKYIMKGLEKTNSNAYSRTIVLHGWESVSNVELYPNGTPEGWGCPAVSNVTMSYLDALLSKKKKPVLMWIYF